MNSIATYLSRNPLYIVMLAIVGITLAVVACLLLLGRGETGKASDGKEAGKPELTPRQKKANDIVNVRDIDENFLYTREDGYLIGYLRIGNLNIELLSTEELEIKTQRLAMSFEGDRKNFDYFTLPSQVNLDPNKDFLKRIHQETEDIGRRKGINLMLQEMTRLSTSGENFEHQHFIKLWCKIGTNIKDTQNELRVRLNEFKERYVQAGIPCEILKDREIIKMCNLFSNPQQAPFTGGNISRYENFTIIKDRGNP